MFLPCEVCYFQRLDSAVAFFNSINVTLMNFGSLIYSPNEIKSRTVAVSTNHSSLEHGRRNNRKEYDDNPLFAFKINTQIRIAINIY